MSDTSETGGYRELPPPAAHNQEPIVQHNLPEKRRAQQLPPPAALSEEGIVQRNLPEERPALQLPPEQNNNGQRERQQEQHQRLRPDLIPNDQDNLDMRPPNAEAGATSASITVSLIIMIFCVILALLFNLNCLSILVSIILHFQIGCPKYCSGSRQCSHLSA